MLMPSPASPLAWSITDVIGIREIVFLVILIALIIFWVQYRKRQM